MTVRIEIEAPNAESARDEVMRLFAPQALVVPKMTGEMREALASATAGEIISQRESFGATAAADAEARAKGENIDGSPRRGRGRPKKDATVADLPADVVAEAKAAGVNVSDQPGGADVVAEQQAEAAPETEAEAEAPALTETDVRNAIIDVLNAVVQKHEDDPDIRVKTLKPLLASVDAEKISSIKPERYADVMAKLAEIKVKEGIE